MLGTSNIEGQLSGRDAARFHLRFPRGSSVQPRLDVAARDSEPLRRQGGARQGVTMTRCATCEALPLDNIFSIWLLGDLGFLFVREMNEGGASRYYAGVLYYYSCTARLYPRVITLKYRLHENIRIPVVFEVRPRPYAATCIATRKSRIRIFVTLRPLCCYHFRRRTSVMNQVVREGQTLHFGLALAPSRRGTIVTLRDAFFKWPVRRKASNEVRLPDDSNFFLFSHSIHCLGISRYTGYHRPKIAE